MNAKAVPTSEDRSAELAALVERITANLQGGAALDLEEVLRQHPEYAAELRELLPAMAQLVNLSHSADAGLAVRDAGGTALGELGDFRLIREVGRGGMGVVYEAEQRSLRRKVALKVLPFAATMDARRLQRFQNESLAAASLHHPHIVPVYGVGCERGVHYYAMHLIDGVTLARVIRDLSRPTVPTPTPPADATGAYVPAGEGWDDEPDAGDASAPTPVVAALSTERGTQGRHYYRSVARLMAQAADALEYAHSMGVVHRDVKPANLLLDAAGHLWVTDFGLARFGPDAGLTISGDLLGTLRYMAPEQVLARHGLVDHRADVYALGATLYELLTGRPVVDAAERAAILRQIAFEEPTRPRKRDKSIPTELETITMKCLAKNPAERYATAGALADDLRRYLADQPIRARRAGPVERARRWGRRHPALAAVYGLAVLVLVLATSGGAAVWQWQVAVAALQQRDEVKDLNDQLQRTLYASNMNLAHHAWEDAAIPRVLELLEPYRPKAGESDLRGFEWFYLYRLCHAELLTLKGHTDRIRSVVYSPDGKRLASVDRGGTVQVWDAQTGRELLALKGGGIGLAFSPDGKRLAIASPVVARGGPEGLVKVCDAQTGQELLALQGHTGNVGSLAFSPDGKRLASISLGWDEKQNKYVPGELKVRDAQTGHELLSLKGGGNHVTFSLDGKRLAGVGFGAVKIWDAQTGQEFLSRKSDDDSVAFSPDGKRLAGAASVSGEGWTVKVRDAQTGQVLLTCKGHNGQQINSVTYSPDGKRLASTGGDRTVRVWDAQTGQELLSLKGHASMVQRAVFSPDGTRLASTGLEGTIKVWDATTGPEARTFSGPTRWVHSVAFSPNGKRLAAGGGIWDDTKNDYVAVELKVLDAQTGQELLAFKGHTSGIGSVAYSPDGKRLASASDDKTVKVWDAQTGQELLSLQGHSNRIGRVAFSPDGKRLASASDDKTVKVWDAQTGRELLTFKGHTGIVRSVAFSPDGKRLASVGAANAQRGAWDAVKVWDAQTGQELLSIKGQGALPCVAFSPDGKRLAGSWHRGGPGAVGEVQVWDAETGKELLSLKGHATGVSSVAFSPDSKRLASGSGNPSGGPNGEVKVWDVQTGQELLTLKGGGSGHRVTFSPNGHWLASVARGTVKIYDATPLPEKP